MADSRKKQEFVARLEREFKDQYTGPDALELVAGHTRRALKDARVDVGDADFIVSKNQAFVTKLLMRAVTQVAARAYDEIGAEGAGGSKRSV